MKIMNNPFARLSIASAFCVLLATPALALDTDTILQRLEESLNANNFTLIGGNVTTEGNNIIVENFGIEAPSLDGAENLTLRLNDITEGGDGSFTIAKLSIDDSSVEISGDRLDFSGVEIEQLYLPAEAEPLYANAYLPYKSIKMKNFVLYNRGNKGLNGNNAYIEVSDFEVGKKIKYQAAVESFSFEMESLDREPAQNMKDMGYDTISGRIDFSGGTDFETSLFDFENFAITLDNIGTLSLSLQFSGYTPAVAQAMAEMSANAGDNQAVGLALLGVAQQLKFNSFSLRFDDNSITNKALDFASGNTGSSRADMINVATAGVQFGLAQFLPMSFTVKASQAIGSYLQDPQSLEVIASPEQPLPVMMIAASAQDPASLIEVLGVDIRANIAR